jgi:hypothetical protein
LPDKKSGPIKYLHEAIPPIVDTELDKGAREARGQEIEGLNLRKSDWQR